ncbi:MAG: archaeosortase/exosortase family protein, partial [Deltaproteobacteria bacterium]
MNRESMRWLLLFIALTGAFYWVDQTEWFNTLILSRVALVDAEATIRLLSFLGMPLERTGATIITPAGAIEIAKSCTGSFVFMMFSAAVLPFPTTWRLRLKGIFLG